MMNWWRRLFAPLPPERRPVVYIGSDGRGRVDREALHASPGYKRQIAALKLLEEYKVMGDKTKGLHHKYTVKRTDGSDMPGQKHHACHYYVLDTTHDAFAIPALKAYADACESEYPLLAADIRAAYLS